MRANAAHAHRAPPLRGIGWVTFWISKMEPTQWVCERGQAGRKAVVDPDSQGIDQPARLPIDREVLRVEKRKRESEPASDESAAKKPA